MVTVQKYGVSIKELPLKEHYEENNDGAKDPDKLYDIDKKIGQEQGWE